jgi:hypothetical protein
MEQVIYSRLEYPIGESVSSDSIFDQFSYLPRELNDCNTQIGGVSVTVRCTPRAVIFLTYDEESDSHIKLGYSSIPGSIYTNLRKSKL